MSTPRNMIAYHRGAHYSAKIRQFLEDWYRDRGPFARSPYACEVQRAVPDLALRTVQWHMARIREQDAHARFLHEQDKRCVQRNSSEPTDAIS